MISPKIDQMTGDFRTIVGKELELSAKS